MFEAIGISSLAGQFGRYVVVGALSALLDAGLLALAVRATGVSQGVALVLLSTGSFSVGLLNSYWWNARWTFGVATKSAARFAAFVMVNVVALGITDLVIYLATSIQHPWLGTSSVVHVMEAKAVALAVAGIWNFLAFKYLVFRPATAGGSVTP